MAEFPGLVFTDVGRAMISRAGSNKKEDKLIVTRADFGDGMYEGDISRLTNIVSKKLSATIVSYKDNMNGQWSYTFSYDNSSLNVGFNHREVGIFAKNGETGTEKLLCYSNAGNRYSYLGSKDKLIPLQTMTAHIALGDLKNVTAVIDVSNAVKLQQVLEEIGKHNKNEGAHLELFSTDATPTTDQGLGSNNSFLNLGARIKWVKSYVKNAMSSYKEFVAEQIKDFGAGVLKYLLSKTATNLSTLEEGSVAYQIVDAVLRVSGRRYSLSDNGYILFGKLFGGFCIQWGTISVTGYYYDGVFQLKFSKNLIVIPVKYITADDGMYWGITAAIGYAHTNNTGFRINVSAEKSLDFRYIALGTI